MNNQKGQLILILILVMTVALAIGLYIVQKSLVDVSTSTKVEQSSRAFSAAEAGIEKALRGDTSGVNFTETDSRTKEVSDSGLIPCTPGSAGCSPAGSQQDPLQYPPVAKEDVIQFWLADPDPNVRLPDCSAIDPTKHQPVCYGQNSLDVYWGNSQDEIPAIALTFVYFGTDSSDSVDGLTSKYRSRKFNYDPNSARAADNGFTSISCSGSVNLRGNTYQCQTTVRGLPAGLMLVRARLLYNSISQPIAIRASWPCSVSGCYLPPQAREIVSIGVSGETERKVELFQLNNVVPPYFDYAIFSAGDIEK